MGQYEVTERILHQVKRGQANWMFFASTGTKLGSNSLVKVISLGECFPILSWGIYFYLIFVTRSYTFILRHKSLDSRYCLSSDAIWEPQEQGTNVAQNGYIYDPSLD